MNLTAKQLNNAATETVATIDNDTKKLIRYGIQLAMLNKLLSQKLITETEHHKIKEKLKYDY